jgi:CRP-like cAMP-binding protein
MGTTPAFRFTTLSYLPAQIITVEGQKSDRFFIIQSGQVRISKEINSFQKDTVLGPGAFFAVVATMANHAQIETAQALSDVTVVAVPRAQFAEVVKNMPRIALKIIQQFSGRMRYLDHELAVRTLQSSGGYEDGAAQLRATGEYYDALRWYKQATYCYERYLFQYPTGAAVDAIQKRLAALPNFVHDPSQPDATYAKDDIIFAEGEMGNVLYVITTGAVKITKIIDKKEITLAILKKGDMFGEMAILESKPRSASAVAYDACTLLAIKIDSVESMAASQPVIVQRLTETLAERLWFIDKQFANTLFIDPVGRMFDGMAMHLEKAGVSLYESEPYEFSFGLEELARMVGIPSSQRAETVAEVMHAAHLHAAPGKLVVDDVREIAHLRQFYMRMQKRKQAILKEHIIETPKY